jgi:hypothetical protein
MDHVTSAGAEYLDRTSASFFWPDLSHLVLRPRRRTTALPASLLAVLPALSAGLPSFVTARSKSVANPSCSHFSIVAAG